MAGKLRLFWAVNLPEELKLKIFHIQERLKKAGAEAKWVEHQNLHITVKFLGDTEAGAVARIVDAAAAGLKDFKPFRLDVGGLGFFPGPASPRVLWAGVKGEVDALREAVRVIEDAMAGRRFTREARKFSPHLTLARIKTPGSAKDLAGLVGAGGSREEKLGGFDCSSVDLMQSSLTPRGPVYTLLAAVRLTGTR